MPIPFFWLGAAAVSALAVKELVSDDRKKQQQARWQSPKAKRLNEDNEIGESSSAVAIYPSDLFHTEQVVKPRIGAVVCCGIGGVLDHTGIWIGDDTIVELGGNGLIKPVSPARFTQDRSGKDIFIACDSTATPLVSELAAQRAIERIYQYCDYHLIENNCHQFVWQCIEPNGEPLTTFRALNKRLAKRHNKQVYWDLCSV